MKVTLISERKLYNLELPSVIADNYWITDKTKNSVRKLININGQNGKWQIESTNYAQIFNIENIKLDNLSLNQIQNNIIDRVTLKEDSMYLVCISGIREKYILYCSPSYEEFQHVDILNTKEFTIGNSINNQIVYSNPFTSATHAKLFLNNGMWLIKNYDNTYGTFVNKIPLYNETKRLSNGDIIFINGLKIIIMQNSLYINNPLNSVNLNHQYFEDSKIKNSELIENDEPTEEEILRNPVYYSRSPRITSIIKKEKIKIDEPPQSQNDQDKPMALLLGSTLSMGAMMLTSVFTTLQGITNGTSSILETILSIITAIAMLIGMLVIPFLDIKYDKKTKIKYEKKRKKKYKEYLNKKKLQINKISEKQKKILFENYISAEDCSKIILSNSPRLWERKYEDKDFLSIRLGIGDYPLQLEISYPEEKFELENDELLEELHEMVEDSKTIKNVPFVISLVEKNISAFISKNTYLLNKFMQNIILQLVTFQSYSDLKLVFLLNGENSQDWEYVKILPHVWDDAKQIRFFADSDDDMNEVSKYLEEEFKNRISKLQKNPTSNTENEKTYKLFDQYFLIITNDYKKVESLGIINDLCKSKKNLGFGLLCLTDDFFQLPNECKTFVSIDNEKATMFDSESSISNQNDFNLEPLSTIFFDKIVPRLANIPIRVKEKGTLALPKNLNFLEMYDVGRIEKLNILDRWKRNDSTLSLKAPIGVNERGVTIYLDAHERFHGPHGLIAGSTGSGKSEFIITYILSLAINYHPDDVTFLLIDYKGGGLAGAFQKNNVKLPHLVGTITNIDKAGLQRSLTSIQSELRRRQVLFNQTRDMTDEGTIDIYKYQRLYHEGVIKDPIPHLFIICDEFAELKQQQDDFMEELMSVSRIGRSLGVHLILATQKPAGIVNDQIRSNSKFAICLKVQDTTDSDDVIRKPDAAYLKNAGQFYMQVGQDEYFVLGQSGWAGASYIPSDLTKKVEDNSINFISNIGYTVKNIDETKQILIKNEGEQLTNLVKYIYDLAKKENIEAKQLWLENIPADIYLNDLREKYNVKIKKNSIETVLGEYDDPSNQKQGILKIDLMNKENVLIYGNAESGKETLLSTMLYDLMTTYSSEEIQFYILDFGSEALKIFKNSPHVGDVLFMGENEKIERFFEMIQKEIKKRKTILSNYSGDYNLYISKGKKMPLIEIIFNNYEAFDEIFNLKYDDLILTLTREGTKCGILFTFTTSGANTLRYRLAQNFNRTLVLQLNSDDEYSIILDNVRNKRPSHIFGRGLVPMDDGSIFEFQTARICKHSEYNDKIESTIEKLNEENPIKALPVPVIPNCLELKTVEKYLDGISKIPIGMKNDTLDIYCYNFTKRIITILTSKNMNIAIDFLSELLELLEKLKDINIKILDAEEVRSSKDKDYSNAFTKFKSEIEKNIKKKDNKFTLAIIIGIEKFIADDSLDENEFNELITKVEDSKKGSFIIIDNPKRLNDYTYLPWYANHVDENSGIWVGNGIENQQLIKINFEDAQFENNCGTSFGYVIEDGETTFLKFIGLKEMEDKDE